LSSLSWVFHCAVEIGECVESEDFTRQLIVAELAAALISGAISAQADFIFPGGFDFSLVTCLVAVVAA